MTQFFEILLSPNAQKHVFDTQVTHFLEILLSPNAKNRALTQRPPIFYALLSPKDPGFDGASPTPVSTLYWSALPGYAGVNENVSNL